MQCAQTAQTAMTNYLKKSGRSRSTAFLLKNGADNNSLPLKGLPREFGVSLYTDVGCVRSSFFFFLGDANPYGSFEDRPHYSSGYEGPKENRHNTH